MISRMEENLKIGFFVIRSKFEIGAERGELLLSQAREELKKRIDVYVFEEVVDNKETLEKAIKFFKSKDICNFCVLLATWSDDSLILDLLSEIKLPVIVWSIPGIHYGSLCGGQQICCVLKELGIPYKFIFGNLEDASVYEKILSYSKTIYLINALSKAKFGLLGHRISGMTEVAYDEIGIKKVFGSRMVLSNNDRINLLKHDVKDEEILEVYEKLRNTVGRINVEKEDVFNSIKFYLALKKWVTQEQLNGIAIECYPELMGDVCLAFSLLSEEGIVSACEGDVNSLIATFILYKLAGQPVNNTDLLDLNFLENWAIFSHCGSSGFSIAANKDKISIVPVRLANKGVCCHFPCKKGDVTLLNLVGGRDSFRSFIIQGQSIETDMVFPGNPIKVVLPIKIEEFLQIIEENGFGHHWMIGYGRVANEIEELFKILKINYVTKG
ncbi:MAG: hypothetical protein NC913_07040 [Candidatus Omnitrophica bacterium]|nr:hypothetical protein [Candidatus Omnitrophota bacterium]